MVLQHVWGLFKDPAKEWQAIREKNYSTSAVYGQHTFLMAAVPAVAGYVGTTQIGWQFGAGEAVKLTTESALMIAVAYYIAMLVGVFIVGYMIKWMSVTYCDDTKTLDSCIVLASYTATPLFLIGVMELFPILWLNLILGLPALAYTVYIFYLGVPIVIGTNKEKGFLFATAVMGFGMVAFVALLAMTALMWGFGLGPKFVS